MKNTLMRVPVPIQLLVNLKLDKEFQSKLCLINKNNTIAIDQIVACVSLFAYQSHSNWKRKIHPRVSINSQTFKQHVGSNYSDVLKFLEKENVIEVNHSYCKGKFCKHYWLTDAMLESGIMMQPLQDPTVIKRVVYSMTGYKVN